MGWNLTYPEAIVIAAAVLGVSFWLTFGDLGACIRDGLKGHGHR